ncbi:MAG TPA: FHA domain-containing protein, partial [Polyangiaceae bacterium]|nr:FHA domain-containing protein [Polyangiaceae bacterium]
MNSPPDVDRHSFTVVVSEKGGAERRQTFDTTELNVGRVQGNELMLPKGNVSKRHARLLFRDGRFIVTDLNSTNGTYVNRRRIAQATIVREGDRIYIGDFVLRIEFGALETFDDKTGNTGRPSFPSAPDRGSSSDGGLRVLPQDAPGTPSSPDDLTQLPGASGLQADSDGPTPNLAVRERLILAEAEAAAPASSSSDSLHAHSPARRRAAVQAVVSHVLEVMDEASLLGQVAPGVAARVKGLASDKAKSLAEGRELDEGLTAEEIAEDAVAELLELGPLGPLLSDSSVTHIASPRYDQLTVTRAGRLVPLSPTFSCVWSLNAALRRLAARANYQLTESENLLEFSLPDGARVAAARGDVAPTGTLLIVRKPRRVNSTLEKLVRRGAISRAMATFLGQCVQARLNLLVVGPREEGPVTVLSALWAACVASEHLVALSGIDDVLAHSESATRLNMAEAGTNATQLLQIAARIPEARVVATLADGADAAAAIEAIGDGIDGVIASFRAPDLRRAMDRLPADLSVARPGLSLDAAREWLRSSFDVVLEVLRLRDGRLRVLRIAEFGDVGSQGIELIDIFRFVVERVATGGAIEGSFVAGDRPRVVDRMASRGIETDASLFARSQSQSQ